LKIHLGSGLLGKAFRDNAGKNPRVRRYGRDNVGNFMERLSNKGFDFGRANMTSLLFHWLEVKEQPPTVPQQLPPPASSKATSTPASIDFIGNNDPEAQEVDQETYNLPMDDDDEKSIPAQMDDDDGSKKVVPLDPPTPPLNLQQPPRPSTPAAPQQQPPPPPTTPDQGIVGAMPPQEPRADYLAQGQHTGDMYLMMRLLERVQEETKATIKIIQATKEERLKIHREGCQARAVVLSKMSLEIRLVRHLHSQHTLSFLSSTNWYYKYRNLRNWMQKPK